MPTTPARPFLSIIVPLVDHRGFVERAVASWLGQAGGGRHFELVIVATGRSPGLEQRVRGLLRADDQVVCCRSANEAILYNAGARAARGDLLLLTESHVLAAPRAIEQLLDYFHNHEVAAANLGGAHISPTPLAQLDEHLWEQQAPAVAALGEWRCVGLRGFAIWKRVFRQVGPLDEACLRFAETVLAIKLHRAGQRIGTIALPLLQHVNSQHLRGLIEPLRLGFHGECAFWLREPALAAEYFGPSPPWARFRYVDRASARLACRAILHSWWQDRGRPGWWRKVVATLGQLPRLVASAVLGLRWPLLVAHGRARWLGLSLQARVGSRRRLSARHLDALLPHYLTLRQAWSTCGPLEYLAQQPLLPAPVLEPDRTLPVTELDGRALVGFFPREIWDGQGYHWSQPVAALRFQLPPGDYRIELDVHATGTLKDRCLRLWFNGHSLPPREVHEENGFLRFGLRQAWFAPAGEQQLIFTCAPFRPRQHGLPDPRDLGVALFSIAAQPWPAVDREGRALPFAA